MLLLVEDEETLRLALADNLEDEGYTVHSAATAAEARAAWGARDYELVILDLMLPDGDGYTLARELRAAGKSARILMLTARTLEEDLVRGLDCGADDYLRKPYRLGELLARVRALLRRGPPRPEARVGEHRIDRAGRRILDAAGREVALTKTELSLLLLFVDHPGRAFSRDEILDAVWGQDVVVDARTVDNFVSSLKKKLGWRRGVGPEIATVRGVGYRFSPG